MAETRLDMAEDKKEFKHIMKLIGQGGNFLLSGGAGSGKTYSLVEVIREVISNNPTTKVACMTYTNAAVKEIEERVNHKNLNVSTIHDFLWDNIKHFQNELKYAIISLINDEQVSYMKITGLVTVPDDFYMDIEVVKYKEYLRLKDGIISHDELIIIAEYMFNKYPKLCDVVKDRYKYIFVDEYQDTHSDVVKIFLEHFNRGTKKCLIGFFGDAMQSIYDDSIGNLDEYKAKGLVTEVLKVHNRRNPQKVIDLANKIRTDGLQQEPLIGTSAPNIYDGIVKIGKIIFLYSSDEDISKARKYLTSEFEWDFNNSKSTKELNLTHNLIADKAGFRTLYDIYDKDPILGLMKELLVKIKEKNIEISGADSFDNVVDLVELKNRQKQLKKEVILSDNKKNELYNQLKDLPFSEVKRIYVSKDQLIDDKKQEDDDENKKGSKRDDLIRHLFKIQDTISLYNNGYYTEFLKATDYKKLNSVMGKKILKESIEILSITENKTIEDIITIANDKGICKIGDKLTIFKEENKYLYNRVKQVNYSEFQDLYKYLEGHTPFSTQHKTKGNEFDNVFVILDNGKWNNYNFEKLFTETSSSKVIDRTKKIFYVCCTRTKEQLAVYYHNPPQEVITKAEEWFGDVINLDNDNY